MAKRAAATHKAAFAGFDLSTTGLALGVRSKNGTEDFVQMPIQGATTLKGGPAFELSFVPGMIEKLLTKLAREGWDFSGCSVSFSVRQHDMALLDRGGNVLLPALSWQCNAATKEVLALCKQGAEAKVGRIEERFILPKLMWVLRTQKGLKGKVAQAMTTGDWIGQMLTGKGSLSTSDAISNGLLDQSSKRLAAGVMRKAGLSPSWFPKVVQSGDVIGKISTKPAAGDDGCWQRIKELLAGGRVVAGLGDNHATGVGCGLAEKDFQSIVVSAGTSGTINRVCPAGIDLLGGAACFEFYQSRMLLMMLHDCCKWYDRFVDTFAKGDKDRLGRLNSLAEKANLDNVRRVLHADGSEGYPLRWAKMTLGEKVASTQFSIMLELLLHTKAMLAETPNPRKQVNRFVLTGGLSQSAFFQKVFQAGAQYLIPSAKVEISARSGPMKYQTAAYGALLNSMRPEKPGASRRLCPTEPAAKPSTKQRQAFDYLLAASGL